MQRSRFAALLAFAVFSAGALAQAPDECANLRQQLAGEPRDFQVSEMFEGGCLGGEKDLAPPSKELQKLLNTAAKVDGEPVDGKSMNVARKDVTLSPDERRTLVLRGLAIAQKYAAGLSSAANAQDKPEVEKLQRPLSDAIAAIAAGQAEEKIFQTHPGFWRWEGSLRSLGETKVDIDGLLARAGCVEQPQTPRCEAAVATAEGLLRAATIANRTLSLRVDEPLLAAYRAAANRDARWHSYFEDVKSQYPWENLLNGYRFERSVRGKSGLSGPPTSQIILFHPDVGLEYVADAEAGSKLKPALVLEVIGYNRWHWGDDNKPKNALGASIIATYSDRAGVPSTAWGIMFLVKNKYGLSITQRSGHTGFMLSVDLAGAITKTEQDVREAFRFGK